MSELPVQLLLSDIDGTLLRRDHSLSQANIDAIRHLREAGIHFTLASSRPPRAMRQLIDALQVDLPTVAFNGGTITHADGSLLVAHRIDQQAVRVCLELFTGQDVAIWVFADDQWLLLDPDGDYVDHERDALGYDYVQVESFESYLDRVDKIVAASADFELLKTLEVQLNPMIEGLALAARSQKYYLDVTALEANKGAALVALAQYLKIELPRTAVIGDGGNDVAMFHKAGLSIAMGQGEQTVKGQADHVTDSNEQDGVAVAIRRYILPA
ncbi:Cof-type HAD-IIB family hydrolase [Pseudomonas syringae pv. tagetis]|uniref:Cof-like hydrolase family protein n=1 Tax=Pseudomonas syringae pv. tagetis TaxID=129140 RepID=A0A0Q0C4V5_9PSED|nr:Cof-type HAD-IIB family hydrolase [Pseudomonas syringae group genomosp. 7]KPY80851.1 Cof-like hydrolase family protein [Pseudomonas syringae pv. tagetis]RMW20145.1 Cof protein/HAD-superfamily hydrolase [Pseudomonas syringae pv. tagetis]RMW28479.1 Cof protein/HAD-superfamily hydrolase [Pseudomonas syringae pv. tagetis]UNB66578.1 Cof-type HAD-IIB family hydrolase [Pseudomonas syringae pv. tagetis]